MDFMLCVKLHRGIGASCGHLSSYFQPPEPLSQKSTPWGLNHTCHSVICIFFFFLFCSFFFGESVYAQSTIFPVNICSALTYGLSFCTEHLDHVVPKSFSRAVHYHMAGRCCNQWWLIDCWHHIHFFIVFQGLMHMYGLLTHEFRMLFIMTSFMTSLYMLCGLEVDKMSVQWICSSQSV